MREASIAAKLERRRVKSIGVELSERVCLNCQHYSLYYREAYGNVQGWYPTDTGRCLKKECQRGALRQPCKDFSPERR